MSTRKYSSGYEKLKKKWQREEHIESQKGAIDKFITSKKQNLAENLSEGFINEQEIHQKELEDNENIQQNDNNEVVMIMFKHVMSPFLIMKLKII